ncbi:MAG: glycoside hydrolase family 140 protein [Prolixibacteraceae bacterium]
MESEKKFKTVKKDILAGVLILIGLLMAYTGISQDVETSDNWKLEISDDGLHIQKANGADWFWLGDTGWSLFQELNREDAEFYFSARASQGYTVIQAVAVMGWNREWNEENAYGDCPFIDDNVSKPNEEFWKHADWLIKKARDYGLYIALLPAWGDYWGNQATVEYARWIMNRYKNNDNIIWVNGGDRIVGDDKHLFNQIGNALNEDEDALVTFHPNFDPSSENFHDEKWLDFNMQQSGHSKRNIRVDNQVDIDLTKKPLKPTLNGEPNYEEHCINWDANCSLGTFNAHDVRQLGYWSVFAGATGFTYGHVHVWDFYHGGNHEDGYKDWKVQLNDPGAVQMGYLVNLIMSRPQKGRVPAQNILSDESPGELKQRALQGDGYAFVYTSQGQNIYINLDVLPWKHKKAWWFNPREGTATKIETILDMGNNTFNPPCNSGSDNDWVLVIDDVSKGYIEPGKL